MPLPRRFLLFLCLLPLTATAQSWTQHAPGLEEAQFGVERTTPVGDSTFVVLRIDPAQWQPKVLTLRDVGAEMSLGSCEWADTTDVSIVTNAGMFGTDYRTHVGYLRTATHVNSAGVNQYKSVAAFGPLRDGLPPFRMYDLDETPMDSIQARYQGVMQNLRLIKRPGRNRWGMQDKRWSEMALAEDAEGNALLVFSRSPYPMHVFNEILLELPLDVVAAQHLEGGPEAQLLFRPPTGDTTHVWMGSYETAFYEDDSNRDLWPIPNVLVFAPR
jgi:hypothetical protein